MINFQALLKDAERHLIQQNPDALQRIVQAGVLYSLLRQTVSQYSSASPAQITEASMQLFQSVIKSGTLDDVLHANAPAVPPSVPSLARRPVPPSEAEELSPTEELVPEHAPSQQSAPVGDVDFANMSERQLREMGNVMGLNENDINGLLRARGMLNFKDFDPSKDYGEAVESRTDEDLAMNEARKESAFAGITGFDPRPEDLNINHKDPTNS